MNSQTTMRTMKRLFLIAAALTAATTTFAREYTVPTKFRELHDRCNELLIAFRGDWAVRLRVYDNGAAYRFETARRGETVVEDETAEFNFASDNDTYWTRERNPDFISHHCL